MNAPLGRVGGRVLVIDPAWRVLLINERIEGGTHWLTPGGGVEPGETPRQAAAREATEETGIAVGATMSARTVLQTRRLWSLAGVTYDQVDHIFLAHVDGPVEVSPAGLTDLETETLIGYRWWTAAELRATDEQVEPPGLAGLIDRLRRADAPARTGG